MRQIKFRAWDKEENEMFDSSRDKKKYYDEYWGDVYALQIGLITEISKNERFELMQYTGLLDKNGKEIYEGDILRFGDLLHKGVVEYKDYMWNVEGFYCSGQDSPGDAFGENYDREIIGNIWENPELLTN